MKILFLLLPLLFLGCVEQPEPKPEKLNLEFKPSQYDRVVFITKKNQKIVEITTDYPYNGRFNSCESHVLPEYKNNFATKNSIKMCNSDFELHKKEGKLFFRGTVNLYVDYGFFTFGTAKNQVFNKEVIGIPSDFEDYVYDLVLDGVELKEGINTHNQLGKAKILYLKAGKSYSF